MSNSPTLPNLVAEFRAIMSDDMGGTPSAAHCRAVIEHVASAFPVGPELWALWYVQGGARVAELCEFDGSVCFECYRDAADALATATRLNDGASLGRYIVARIPAGVAGNPCDNPEGESPAFRASGPTVEWFAGMECGYTTCSANVADLSPPSGDALARATAFATLRMTELAASPPSHTATPDEAIAAIEAGLVLASPAEAALAAYDDAHAAYVLAHGIDAAAWGDFRALGDCALPIATATRADVVTALDVLEAATLTVAAFMGEEETFEGFRARLAAPDEAEAQAGLFDAPAPRNPAIYCDGKAREFTAVLFSAPGDTAPRWAAVAGQTCLDALDCVALTEDEAHAAGRAWAARRQIMIGSDPCTLYRVVPLPTGWGDLNAPAPAPVPMVPQPCQQQQGRAPSIRLVTEKNGALIRAMSGDRCLAWAAAFRIGPCPIFDVFPESGPGVGKVETLKATERKLRDMARARLEAVPVLRQFEAPSDDAYRAAAYAAHGEEGAIECDDTATVSRSDEQGGAYVAMWVWVSDDEAAKHMRPAMVPQPVQQAQAYSAPARVWQVTGLQRGPAVVVRMVPQPVQQQQARAHRMAPTFGPVPVFDDGPRVQPAPAVEPVRDVSDILEAMESYFGPATIWRSPRGCPGPSGVIEHESHGFSMAGASAIVVSALAGITATVVAFALAIFA